MIFDVTLGLPELSSPNVNVWHQNPTDENQVVAEDKFTPKNDIPVTTWSSRSST
jgi:hypothetical protein